jgi:hypothetical protein
MCESVGGVRIDATFCSFVIAVVVSYVLLQQLSKRAVMGKQNIGVTNTNVILTIVRGLYLVLTKLRKATNPTKGTNSPRSLSRTFAKLCLCCRPSKKTSTDSAKKKSSTSGEYKFHNRSQLASI